VVLWPHQERAIDETLTAIKRGERRVLVTSPTGGGKTRVMVELARRYLEAGKKVVLYSNRKLLVEQTSEVLLEAGVYHGVRAAGWEDERDHPFQVSSIHTEASRVLRKRAWQLHEADLALVDEAHQQASKTAGKILGAHCEAGAAVVGFTATPVGLGHLYDTLVAAGTMSELRACGALVPCLHYGPDEPDLRRFHAVLANGKDLSEKQAASAMHTPTLFARVLEWFKRLNPDARPTILFAPSVESSLWFAQEFEKAGISAAHIDGSDVYRSGKLYRSSREARADVLGCSGDCTIRVLCNRFVLREGIDAPWLAHGILATVFGSLQSYLQSGGRLLRAHPGLESVTVQDHGGNWWRHGSLNADREWRLDYTDRIVAGLREDRLRGKAEREPFRCPNCAMVLVCGTCMGCGFRPEPRKRSRPVVQLDGTLKEMVGDIYKPRRACQHPDGPKLWERMYWRSRRERGRRTFKGAMALFAQENRWAWPDPSWPLMPRQPYDFYQLVENVPIERLIPKIREQSA
jgi:superfamily II DNA or RNA helicase